MAAAVLPMRVASAQQVLTQPERVITVPRAQSALVTVPTRLTRISVGDPAIAEAVVVSPRELLINGKGVGTTSLFVWDEAGAAHLYSIEVRADVAALERQIRTLSPGIDVSLTASGNSVILSGTIRDPVIARRILELAQATGAQVVNNLVAPQAQQVLLHVQFAEVNRTALQRLSGQLTLVNPQNIDQLGRNSDITFESLSGGIMRLFLLGRNTQIQATLNALRSSGDLRSLAEPNLVTLEGQEATFLAGGEFPYPALQGGAQAGGIGIQFREFGIRLRFTPRVTNTGTVRLHVAPEVSSLDFANGLVISGCTIPALLSRKTESDVELRPGQHLAIAGLVDNSVLNNVDKVPFLGDLPILGTFFRSREARQRKTELLVVVTPHIVAPTDTPPALPTGPAESWPWPRSITKPLPGTNPNWNPTSPPPASAPTGATGARPDTTPQNR